MHMVSDEFHPLSIAVLTVSDTRTEQTDRSGPALVDALQTAGHRLAERLIVPDDIYRIRAEVARWIASPEVHVVIATGGTGLMPRDGTPEAVRPLFDRDIEGFGELFRQVSFEEIGTSTLQSRALAGFANRTVVVCLPGSTGACRTAWHRVLEPQLDARHRPCNLAQIVLPE